MGNREKRFDVCTTLLNMSSKSKNNNNNKQLEIKSFRNNGFDFTPLSTMRKYSLAHK